MKGTYHVYLDGQEVGRYDNLITNFGKESILKFLASNIPGYATAIAVGISDATPSVNDIYMGFEAFRIPIAFKTIDTTSSTIIFKGTAPIGTECQIYELGMFPAVNNLISGPYQTQVLFDFDAGEVWTGVVLRETGSQRLGGGGIVLTIPLGSTTKTIFNNTVRLDLSGYSLTDTFRLAASAGPGVTKVVVKFTTTDGNDIQSSFPISGEGYQFVDVNKSEFSNVNADWANIIRVEVMSVGSEASTVMLDGLQIIDSDNLNPDFGLVSRTLLTTSNGISPIKKNSNTTMDIEYRLAVNL